MLCIHVELQSVQLSSEMDIISILHQIVEPANQLLGIFCKTRVFRYLQERLDPIRRLKLGI